MPYETPNRNYPVPRDGEDAEPDGVDGPLNTVGDTENWGDTHQTAMNLIDADIQEIMDSAVQTGEPLSGNIDMGGNDIVGIRYMDAVGDSSDEASFGLPPTSGSSFVFWDSVDSKPVLRFHQNGNADLPNGDLTLSGGVIDSGGGNIVTGGGEMDAGTGVVRSGDIFMDNGSGNSATIRFRDGGTNRYGLIYGASNDLFTLYRFGGNDVLVADSNHTVNVPNGDLQNRGSRVLTTADEGSGSGLNADQIDGYDIQKNGTDGTGIINFKT